MKCLWLLLMLLLALSVSSTPACWINTDCPPFQQCTITDNHEHCTYINPCICADGILSLVTGELCPPASRCQDTPCASQLGVCQYEGNGYDF